MDFKGNILCIADPRLCIACETMAYQVEKLDQCELPFCSSTCQKVFWEDLILDFEEMETETGSDLFQIALSH